MIDALNGGTANDDVAGGDGLDVANICDVTQGVALVTDRFSHLAGREGHAIAEQMHGPGVHHRVRQYGLRTL